MPDNMSSAKQATAAILIILALAVSVLPQGRQNVSDAEVQNLIAELYAHPWEGPENYCSPMCWDFRFTEPMLGILKIGAPAQNALIKKLNDPAIKDQVIILLGGLSDERGVGPIIDAMVAKGEVASTYNAERINLAAILALTNITVAEVTWHHGGGIEVR